MGRLALLSLVVVGVFAGNVACAGKYTRGDRDTAGGTSGGSTSSGGTNGGGGGTTSTGGSTTGGMSGSAPSGGDAGTPPNGGFAGVAPMGGSSGAGMTGGMAGSGGSGGERECESADDCVMFTDCCSCTALSKGTIPLACDRACITDECSARGIGSNEITCNFGRCVIDRTCNHAKATCDSLPEPCPSGEMRSVTEEGCWGPCLLPTECRDVTADCTNCGDAVCVANAANFTIGCVAPEPSCKKGGYCECLDVCPASDAFNCYEYEESVTCYCLAC